MATILLQETDCDIRDILTFVLTEEGHQVLSVNAYEEAELVVESCKPDVVFLDLVMDVHRCIKTCDVIRYHFPKVPIIVLTCNGRLVKQISNGQYNACIEKPFSLDDIITVAGKFSTGHYDATTP